MVLSISQLCLSSTAPNSASFQALSKCCTDTIESLSTQPNCYFCPSKLVETSLRNCVSELGINLDGDQEENRLELRGFIPKLGDGADGLEGAAGAGGAEGEGAQGGGAQVEGAQGAGEGEEGEEGEEGQEGGGEGDNECQSYTSSPLGPICVKGGKKNGTSQIGEDGSGSESVDGPQPSGVSGQGSGQISITNDSGSTNQIASEAQGRGVGWIGSGLVWGLFLLAFVGSFL